MNGDNGLGPSQHGTNALCQVVERIAVLGEDNQLAPMPLSIEHFGVVLQQAGQPLPLAVGTAAPHLVRQFFQTGQQSNFDFQFGNGARR